MNRLSLVGALAMAMVGCGSEVDTTGGGGSGAGNNTGGGGLGGDGGAGGGDVCAAFADAASPGDLTLRFVNQNNIPVYLPATCDDVEYSITPAAGPDGNYYGNAFGSCSQSCEDLQTEGPIACGACLPTSYRIDPGGALEVKWNQIASHPTMMPTACWSDQQFGPACNQAIAAAAGSYLLGVTASDNCVADPSACTCDPQTGLCDGFAGGMSVQIAPVAFELPTAGPVEIVIPDCTFGCPQPGG